MGCANYFCANCLGELYRNSISLRRAWNGPLILVDNGGKVNVGMPNVLMELQGIQRLNCEAQVLDCRQLIVETGTGLYSQSEFDKAIYDLTNFLHYVGDPSQEQRRSLGVWVLAFLAFLGIFTYLLNREYWKDVH